MCQITLSWGYLSLCAARDLPKLLDLLLHVAHHASSFQVMSSMGPLKIVVIDSVSAVLYPLLGGKQSEGELLRQDVR